MNTLMKDGFGNAFILVTKDQSVDQSNEVRQNWHLESKYPLDHTGGGSWQGGIKSGVLAAGLAANAPIISFRFASTTCVALVRKIKLSAWSLAAGFATGIASFDAYVARGYTVEDSVGLLAALSGNVGKMRTIGMQTTTAHLRVSDTAALTAGTRTLDGQFMDTVVVPAPTTANTIMVQNQMLFQEADHPLVLDNLEGVIVQASVPATGTWSFAVSIAWDEILKTSF